jgi:enolase
MSKTKIKNIHARQLMDSCGTMAIEIDITLRFNAQGRSAVSLSSIANLTTDEVSHALRLVNSDLRIILKGKNTNDLSGLDQLLLNYLDSQPDCRPLQSVIRAISMALLHALADTEKMPLWQYTGLIMGKSLANTLPLPSVEILSQSTNNAKTLSAQSFFVTPIGANSFAESLSWCQAVHKKAQQLRIDRTDINDTQALEILSQSIGQAGFQPGLDIGISVDFAASALKSKCGYHLKSESTPYSRDELSGLLVDWLENYPIISIEDPFSNDDLEGLTRFTWAVGKRTQIVTNHSNQANHVSSNSAAIQNAGNTLNLNLDTAATLSTAEILLENAKLNGYGAIISAKTRSLDQTIPIHLAVGWGINQIKFGPLMQAQNMPNWNEGVRISEAIFKSKTYSGQLEGSLPSKSSFPWS